MTSEQQSTVRRLVREFMRKNCLPSQQTKPYEDALVHQAVQMIERGELTFEEWVTRMKE